VLKVTPDSVVMFEFVRYPTTSSRPPWVRVMWMMEVWRPSFVSLTVNFAGPDWVRRRKSRWRAMVWGWFWEESVLKKCVLATWRKTAVTNPP
jgi:hypothetical protein